MIELKKIFILFLSVLIYSMNAYGEIKIAEITSPDEKIHVDMLFSNDGIPLYRVLYNQKEIISDSRLGFKLADDVNLYSDFYEIDHKVSSFNEEWKQVWGENKNVLNYYNELKVYLVQRVSGIQLTVVFRVYDDGVGFRYEFPQQEELSDFIIMNELTEFKLTGDHLCWWIPGDHDSYEYKFQNTRLSQIDVSKTEYLPRGDRFVSNMKAVNTPLTMKTDDGNYIAIHEAGLSDYADMTLAVDGNFTLKTDLVPWSDGSKVKASSPFNSPWRTILIEDSAADLISSNLIINLNDPNKLEGTSWIEPMKYIGIWWEMHIAKSSWALNYRDGSWSGASDLKHGATTENARRYIDFAATNNIKGVLVEGWNTGWEYWGADTTGFFDFVTPYPDFDLKELVKYAREKGVEIIGHHETAGDVENYEKHIEAAFKYYHDLGIRAVKTGYAGDIRVKGERHHGQFMVRHYQKVVETAAKYGIMVDAHEPIKPTGLRRTYPNMMTREGVRGMEYNAWSDGNMPTHTCTIPFTRLLGGPVDYTPGIFDISIDSKDGFDVKSTIANQLALMVVLYSPLQMAADVIENYNHPAFQFVRDVPTDWDQSVALNGEIGEFVTVARKKGDIWYIGSITNESARTLTIPMNFLDKGVEYEAVIYGDTPEADFITNPEVIEITKQKVRNETTFEIKLGPGGGQAIIIKPISN